MENKYIVVDKLKWMIWKDVRHVRHAQPLCPQHLLRMSAVPTYKYSSVSRKNVERSEAYSTEFECAEGPHRFQLPRTFGEEERYVINRLDAVDFQKVTFIYLDDIAVPVADEMNKDKDSPVWVKTRITESKSGLRLIVWAGNREAKNKTQLFVEPELKRLSFDQNDDHPTEVFARIEATFAGGVKSEISKAA